MPRRPRPYSSKDVAELLGLSPTRFYALRDYLHRVDKMPRPIAESMSAPRWERSGMDCWLLRFHPFAPQQPANDLLPMPLREPTLAEQQAELAREYGRK